MDLVIFGYKNVAQIGQMLVKLTLLIFGNRIDQKQVTKGSILYLYLQN